MKVERLYKQNCMTLKRSSSAGQADTSNANQQRSMDAVLDGSEMCVVAEIDLKGVSGSMPGNRQDIDQIIARKAQLNDFMYLILPCADRFTRSGAHHGQALLYELAKVGIIVYFVQEQIFSDSEYGRLQLSFLFDAARKQASQTSKGTLESQTHSYKEGKSPHTRMIPYGCDRLYSVHDRPLHIIRNLADGSQEQWSPEPNPADRHLLQRFERNPRRGTKNHYTKQKNETLTLIPSAPERIAVVTRIMRMTWIDGLGPRLVAKALNTDCIPAPKGGPWSCRTVWDMARNPIYVGWSVRGRVHQGIYHITNPNGAPIEANRSVEILANNINVPFTRRPRSQWLERPCPPMEDFLPADLREVCKIAIEKNLDKYAGAPRRVEGMKQQVANSPFLLTSIIKSKQGNHKMIGSGSGVKWYVTSYSLHYPAAGRGGLLSRCIAAEPLHKAVMQILKDVMINRPDMEKLIQGVVDKKRQEASGFNVAEAQGRIRALRGRQIAMSKQISGQETPDDPIFVEIENISNEIRQTRISIDKAIAANVDRPSAYLLHKEFVRQSAGLDTMDRPTLKAFLKKVISRMQVDLETREVEMDLTLPSWAKALSTDPRDGRPIGSSLSVIKATARHSRTIDYRPNLLKIRLTRHSRGAAEHYTWVEVGEPTTEQQLKAA